ncbi:hypothetical protein BV22DRAFT_925387 [Leucogyrophana mollusca]|uniref:Uncharacterized protein n=1 Tax=Leucogyrophana mollusca TaxID=85980 RepID=A0ACB8AWX7_9AGAM|nr:hypothetical protein BV22DRAFT_925387 [Leucogyrophana mollusca]
MPSPPATHIKPPCDPGARRPPHSDSTSADPLTHDSSSPTQDHAYALAACAPHTSLSFFTFLHGPPRPGTPRSTGPPSMSHTRNSPHCRSNPDTPDHPIALRGPPPCTPPLPRAPRARNHLGLPARVSRDVEPDSIRCTAWAEGAVPRDGRRSTAKLSHWITFPFSRAHYPTPRPQRQTQTPSACARSARSSPGAWALMSSRTGGCGHRQSSRR